ncbi:hypothetical protein M1513_00540 [Patescibacteria group bacterium]|nr:hypothetical protein [Patescibacteria group bacterium]
MEIQEKKLNEILKSQREDYQRYLGVLTESFESEVKLIAESLLGAQKQLAAISEMIAKNTEDIEIMKMDLHVIKDEIKEKISREEFKIIEKRLYLVEKKLSAR